MKITHIEIQGTNGNRAVLTRTKSPVDIEPAGNYIQVEVFDSKGLIARHHVMADDSLDQRSMAEGLSYQLEGENDCDTFVQRYHDAVQLLAD